MSSFKYQKPFPIEKDTTLYKLLTKDFVSVVEFEGRKILKVDPMGQRSSNRCFFLFAACPFNQTGSNIE